MVVERILPFFGGCVVSGVLVLNHTYETELVKKQLRKEIAALKQMKDFEIDQVAQFREVDRAGKSCDLEDMPEHYRYFWSCTGNAARENLFSFQLTPYLCSLKRKGLTLFEQLKE